MFAQTERPLQLTTPLGTDAIFVGGVRGREALSELFHYEIDAYWQGTGAFPFSQLMGQPVTLTMTNETWSDDGVVTTGVRNINGIVSSVAQLDFDEYLHLRIQVVPKLWTLTRNAQSRIFQQQTVPDILTTVLTGLTTEQQLTGTYKPREYCVQYRETDFAFATRLMEEEGIFYFFEHTSSDHTMVIGDSPQVHPDLDLQPSIRYEDAVGGTRDDMRIYGWSKVQDLRSGKYTNWDFHFQNPDSNYESSKTIQSSLQVGTVTHDLTVGPNSAWELYDYPGDYVLRYDGVSSSGGDQTSNLNDAFADATRTVAIRMKQETIGSVLIHGESNHQGLTPGYKFTLTNHFSDDGEFVLTSVEHEASQPLQVDRNTEPFTYQNRFTAIPVALPYVPVRTTPQPVVHGVQTAIVVGPPGDEIFPDKYGRVKVQFPWDRVGQDNASSSCWLRVATQWAGKQWGAIHIPRIGQEVIVDFLEGDPDHPIIIGSVYNNDQMPPYTLPDNKTQSGIKSRSSTGGAAANYNEFRFEDKMGSEEILLHAEKDLTTEVEQNETRTVGTGIGKPGGNRTTLIYTDETKTVHGKETITIDKDQSLEITQGNQTITLDQGNQTTELKLGNQSTTLDVGNQTTTLKVGNQSTTLNLGNQSTTASVGSISMTAMTSITLTVGGNSITIDQSGITISGIMVTISADAVLSASGDAMTQITGGIVMIN
ncbi:MAG: type VI secretion system tip protein TssI/VgrG [Bryobacteraceae bacterium]|jgi:type VI secretion system secreted protein VgrG